MSEENGPLRLEDTLGEQVFETSELGEVEKDEERWVESMMDEDTMKRSRKQTEKWQLYQEQLLEEMFVKSRKRLESKVV